MKRILGSVMLSAVLAAPAARAQDTFEFEDFDLPMPPPHGMAIGTAFPPPHHGAFVMNGVFPGEMPMDPMHLVMLAERLDLTREQREALGRLADEAMPKMRELMFRMGDARKELETALEGQGRDDAALRALADAQGKLHADLLFLQMSTRQRMRALLTEEQRAQFDEEIPHWRDAKDVVKALRGRHRAM